MENLREKLESEIIACQWVDIVGFLPKADVLIIASDLAIVDVALAFAEDAVEKVKAWLDDGKLQKVDPDWPEEFPEYEHGAAFKLLVVTPFALAQPV